MVKKLRGFFDDIRDTALFIAGLPAALKTTGGIASGLSKTISSPKVSSLLFKGGKIISQMGGKLGGLYSKALGTTVKKAIVPAAKSVGKALPGSKYLGPVIKYIPSTAALYGIVSSGYNVFKTLGEIKQVKDPVRTGLMSTKSNFGKFDPTNPQSYVDLLKRVVTFK